MKLTPRNILILTFMTLFSAAIFFFLMYIINRDEMSKDGLWKLIAVSLLMGVMINVVTPLLMKKFFPEKKK